jgi:MOSC domain-containing protein YiiM
MSSNDALRRTDSPGCATSRHGDAAVFAAGLAEIVNSPKSRGTVAMIVARPAEGARSVLETATLSPEEGLAEDRWRLSSWRKSPDGSPDPAVQITLMNARCIALVAGELERWPLAGDNLFVDLDLSHENLPVGTRLRIGKAILEITEPPHTGCHKFKRRFGSAAVEFVNSPEGKALRLRGVHARVVEAGIVAVGDTIERC